MSRNEWKEYKLGDVCLKITDGAHFSPKEDAKGLPMASVKDLTRFGIEISSCKRISKEDFENLIKQGCAPEIGDVIIAKDGNTSLDTVCVYRQNDKVVLLSSVAILRPSEKVTSDFLNYYFDNPEIKGYLKENFRSGSAIPRVILRDFRNAPIRIPEKKIQEKIGSILRSIDDKIELNRQTAQTLEAIAQAIFKEWFVDFNFPGATGEMQESELGEIPKGWRVGKLREIVELNPKLSIKKGNSAKYVEMKDLSETSLSINRFIEREFTSGSKFQKGDTLFARITPCLENGKTGFVDFLNEGEIGWGSTEFIVLRGKTVSPYFVYCLSRFDRFREFAIKSMVGSSGRQRVVESILAEYTLAIPPKDILNLFHNKVNSIFASIKDKHEQTKTLTQLRDSLLPKLMKGEYL